MPVDGNSCTSDLCTSGTPSNPNSAINTACGSGDFCNGAGTCVDCNSASQCGTSTFCQTFTCTSNTCGTSNTASGTDLPSQTTGDCRTAECNGSGGTMSTINNGDVPVDGNACTNDVCTAGTPSNPNSVINTACGSGDYCNGSGSCVDCTTVTQCPTGNQCQGRACTGNVCSITSLANGTSCNDGLFCTATDTCNGAGTCGGTGSPCDSQCETCNEALNSCPDVANFTSCNDGLFCTSSSWCQSGACSGFGNPCDSQCQACSEGSNVCLNDATGTVCTTQTSGRNNVCYVAQCSGGLCGRRWNRFDNGALTANTTAYAYTNVTTFSTCTACHNSHPSPFSWSEAWSETVSDSVFDSYCSGWNDPSTERTYYGNFRAGCVLYLLNENIMPDGSSNWDWAYDDEYLQWYCSDSGPGGGVNGW